MTKVEVFKDNEWQLLSYHNNEDNGLFNGEVINKSRGLEVRVITDGNIVGHWNKRKED